MEVDCFVCGLFLFIGKITLTQGNQFNSPSNFKVSLQNILITLKEQCVELNILPVNILLECIYLKM